MTEINPPARIILTTVANSEEAGSPLRWSRSASPPASHRFPPSNPSISGRAKLSRPPKPCSSSRPAGINWPHSKPGSISCTPTKLRSSWCFRSSPAAMPTSIGCRPACAGHKAPRRETVWYSWMVRFHALVNDRSSRLAWSAAYCGRGLGASHLAPAKNAAKERACRA